jgi:putative ABC transport system substrate-binding protein
VASVALLLLPRRAWAQPSERRYRLGWLGTVNVLGEPYSQAFIKRLGELGFLENRNLSIVFRDAGGRLETLPSLATDLVTLNCDALFAGGPEATLVALKRASRTTPIVFVAVDFDPVATGHVASLARPGDLVTGITAVQAVLPGKRLELLKELLPRARKVAVFANEQTTGQLAVAQEAARRLGLALHVIEFKRPPFDYESAVANALRAHADALFVLGSGLFVPGRQKIPALALKARLPSVFHHSQWAEAGGLMSYGFNFADMWRRGAEMVAQVLRGARVGDIPMEQPSAYELAINVKTAAVLGITIPPSIQLRADRVVQ